MKQSLLGIRHLFDIIHNIVQQKTNNFKYFPNIVLHDVIKNAVFELYGIEWNPNIIRLKNKKINSSLPRIDYAIPCFKLGVEVGQNYVEVASEIKHHLSKILKNREVFITFNSDNFQLEELDGYLNFYIKDRYMLVLIELTQKWLENPELIGDKTNNKFLIADALLTNDKFGPVVGSTLYYIFSLYKLLDSESSVVFLMNSHKKVDIDKISKSLRSSIQYSEFNDRKDLVKSDLAKEINQFLDDYTKSPKSNEIIIDKDTNASYFYNSSGSIPLRSVKGTLSDELFILFYLNIALSETNVDAVVVIAPQKIHQFLYDWTKLVAVGTNKIIVCYDPQVSRADTIEIKESSLDFEEHFTSMSKAIGSLKNQPDLIHFREDLLLLIDFPVEISLLVEHYRFPGIFDLINQTRLSLSRLIS